MNKKLKNNLTTILKGHPNQETLEIIISEILDFMMKTEWRGACHESCGVLYVLLRELNIDCDWRLGEVFYKKKNINGRPVCFDHSWILINDEIFDLSLCKTNRPDLDSFSTIMNINIDSLGEPEVIYDTDSVGGDDPNTQMIKKSPLSMYFDNSPMHKSLGTWALIQQIGRKIGIFTSIVDLRKEYNGIYWK